MVWSSWNVLLTHLGLCWWSSPRSSRPRRLLGWGGWPVQTLHLLGFFHDLQVRVKHRRKRGYGHYKWILDHSIIIKGEKCWRQTEALLQQLRRMTTNFDSVFPPSILIHSKHSAGLYRDIQPWWSLSARSNNVFKKQRSSSCQCESSLFKNVPYVFHSPSCVCETLTQRGMLTTPDSYFPILKEYYSEQIMSKLLSNLDQKRGGASAETIKRFYNQCCGVNRKQPEGKLVLVSILFRVNFYICSTLQ